MRLRWPRTKTLVRLCGGFLLAATILFFLAWEFGPFDESRLDELPESPVLLDQKGKILFATVGSDEQWRLPVPLEEMSPWLVQATLALEDERFHSHPGLDPLSILRATCSNLSAGRVVSGASTVDMQVCRMLDEGPRTLSRKLWEAGGAIRLNALRNKNEILEIYLNLAPYGGNLRGVEAASRSYFGKRSAELSLSEAALLAGLPQSPERFRPDRRLAAALKRREKAFSRMVELEMISEQMAEDARRVPLNVRGGNPVKQRAPHFSLNALGRRPEGGATLFQSDLQEKVERLQKTHLRRFLRGIESAVVLIEIETGAVAAMAGSTDFRDPVDGQVNGALARRSPGSALKPFVYATAMEQGRIAHDTVLKDLPATFSGWAPRNFDRSFSGEVSVEEALRRSLNLPAVFLAREVGLSRCIGVMESCGVALPPHAAARGGLSVVLGGVETDLLSLTNAYATIGRGGVRKTVRFFADESSQEIRVLEELTCKWLDRMLSSRRYPPLGRSPNEISWFMRKTGTSAGKRDAWAVGHNGKFAIGVWVGRFSGMGDEAFVGATAAEPLLADLFDLALVRVDGQPDEPQPLLVRLPLASPKASAEKLHILFPEDGATYQGTPDLVTLIPRATRGSGLQWFLNDRFLDTKALARLEVGKGSYVLRCLPSEGGSAAIRFRVR